MKRAMRIKFSHTRIIKGEFHRIPLKILKYNEMKTWCLLSLIALFSISCSVDKQENSASDMSFRQIEVINSDDCLWKYKAGKSSEEIAITPPKFEVNGQMIAGVFQTIFVDSLDLDVSRNMKAYTLLGNLKADSALYFKLIFHISENSPFVKFKYELFSKANHRLTKSSGNDNLDYLTFKISDQHTAKELRLSDYSHKNHSYVPRLLELKESQFSNNDAVMGPIFIGEKPAQSFLIAYEHGSQYPNAYLNYRLDSTNKVTLSAIKGNYLNNQAITKNKPFETTWFQIGSVDGKQRELAKEYRSFILNYQSPNTESRKPYVYYNTWGRQEREKWSGKSYQGSITKPVIEKEIKIAHQMGIDVFVIDVGWFDKAGAWNVNTTSFPDTLKQINKLLESKDMKPGLWYNPSITAVSSEVALNHQKWLVRKDGNIRGPFKVWETEKSVNVCMVSDYWRYHADQMIALSKLTGSKYFKWDGIDFDICNDPNHHHGNESNTPKEREESYGFLMPIYMTKIAQCVQEEIPGAIFDFDVTEATRAVGLSFLSVGKYFAMNNGPYFHNYDLAEKYETPLPNGCSNVFVNPGPARGWIARSILDYDKWIPMSLFLTHYQVDGGLNSVNINVGSLILGQNGIWGDILNLPDENVQLVNTILTKYKTIREDILKSTIRATGNPGDAIEVYEKINPATGNGAIVIISNEGTEYAYCSYSPCSEKYWSTQDVNIERDETGLCKITSKLEEHNALIVLFGVE